MDFTLASKSSTKKSQSQSQQEQHQMFYTMADQMQLSQSTANQFANFTRGINNNLHMQEQSFQQDKSQKCKNSGLHLVVRVGQKQQLFDKKKLTNSQNCTYYGSIENKLSNSSVQSPTSPSITGKAKNQDRVSLLQTSLRLQKSQSSQSNQKSNKSSSASKNPALNQQNFHVFQSALQKTKLSDKAPILLSVLISSSRGRQNEHNEEQSQVKTDSDMKRTQKNKKYRIQGPDDVYTQLQNEKVKQLDKKQKQRASKIVNKNLNNTKAMLQQTNIKSSPNSNKNDSSMNSNASVSVPTSSINNFIINKNKNEIDDKRHKFLPEINKYCCECLIRLSMPNQQQQQSKFYHKCKYELNQTSLIIKDVLIIRYKEINKIKIIHSEYNRPQIKITFMMTNKQVQKNRHIINTNEARQATKIRTSNEQKNQDEFQIKNHKQKNTQKNQEGFKQIVVYLCQCYEVVYMIYSYIVVNKLINMNVKINQSPSQNCNTHGFQYSIKGIILKKSKFLKNWQKRYAQIANFKLKSYRITAIKGKSLEIFPELPQNYKIQKQSTFQLQHIKQMWTRFEVIQQKYLVVKMFKKNKIQKYEIAIPIMNFNIIGRSDNWMFGLVGLLKGQI